MVQGSKKGKLLNRPAGKKAGTVPRPKASTASKIQKVGRVSVAPKKPHLLQKQALDKKLSSKINQNIEQSLAAKASTLKPLSVLQQAAKIGKETGKGNEKTGRAIKGMVKKTR